MTAPDTRSGERTRELLDAFERLTTCAHHNSLYTEQDAEAWAEIRARLSEPHASQDGEGERAFVVNRVAHFIATRLGFEYDDQRVIAVARRIVDDARALSSDGPGERVEGWASDESESRGDGVVVFSRDHKWDDQRRAVLIFPEGE